MGSPTPTTSTHDGLRYGVVSLKFGEQIIGLIDQEGIEFGGDQPSTVPIYSAQKRNAPVAELDDAPGSTSLSFELIELKAEQLVAVLGGEVDASKKKWIAPAGSYSATNKVQIETFDGTVITYGKAKLTAQITGKLKHNEVLKVKCTLKVLDAGKETLTVTEKVV